MNRSMLSMLFLLLAFMLFLFSCNSKGKTFRIKGEITSADGRVLYLEHRGLGGLEILDSIKLKRKGRFSFKEKSPDNPEFYQLRLGEQVVVFAVDSIDKLMLSADGLSFYKSHKFAPALPNEQIKEVMHMQFEANREISNLMSLHENKKISDTFFMDQVDSVLSIYKTKASNVILANPASASAYFAVFQKIGDYLIFDPYDKKDYPMFATVATSWNEFYPETDRTKHLYNFTMNAMRARKQSEKQGTLFDNVTVVESHLPDISLANVKGETIKVSSFKGNIVLLDFTAYKTEYSLKHNEIINRVFDKFKSKGLVVYQISFDSDVHFWKNVAADLPWISVYEPQSIYSSLLKSYNIHELPTAYIVDKEGDLIQRIEDFDKFEQYIGELLQ